MPSGPPSGWRASPLAPQEHGVALVNGDTALTAYAGPTGAWSCPSAARGVSANSSWPHRSMELPPPAECPERRCQLGYQEGMAPHGHSFAECTLRRRNRVPAWPHGRKDLPISVAVLRLSVPSAPRTQGVAGKSPSVALTPFLSQTNTLTALNCQLPGSGTQELRPPIISSGESSQYTSPATTKPDFRPRAGRLGQGSHQSPGPGGTKRGPATSSGRGPRPKRRRSQPL